MAIRTYLAIVLWMAALAAAASLFSRPPATVADYRDFPAYYVGSLAMRESIDPYKGNYDTIYAEVGRPLGDLHMDTDYLADTPTWTLLLESLTFLSFKTAYWTWQALNILALAGALFLLIRELGPPGTGGWVVAAAMILYPPIALSISFGRGEMVLLCCSWWR